MKPVEIVKIDKIIPIFKNGEPALNIEVVRIRYSDEEACQFNIVVGKNQYRVNDPAVFCLPDFSLPPISLFNGYYFPEHKSRLGKKGRIRAVKFNFSFAGESEPIYSNGILIPMAEFNKYAEGKNIDMDNLQESLQIIKYVADDSADSAKSGLTKGEIPYFLYKTDENRCELNKRVIDECYESKEVLSFTKKIDGSSCTIYYRTENGEEQFGICSREMEKKLDQTYVSAYKDGEFLLHRYFQKDTNEKGWYNDFTQKFYTDKEVEQFEKVISEARDTFVDTVKKNGYLDKLISYCKTHNLQLALRGELIGAGNKGSGNKLNADAQGDPRVVWFGVDALDSGVAQRIHYTDKHNLKNVCEALELEYTPELFEGVFSYHEIISKALNYFKEVKEKTGQVVEGIVVRSKYSNRLSCKYINGEYDSRS